MADLALAVEKKRGMPLDALFFSDHHVLDDHTVVDPLTAAAWPMHHMGTLRPIHTSLNGGGAGPPDMGEEPPRSLMEIVQIGLPEKGKLDDLSAACKFDRFTSVFGDADAEGATKSAKALGSAIVKSSECNEQASDLILSNIFGKKIDEKLGGMGVTLAKTHDIPLGSLGKKSIKSTKDSCQDFGSFLLRRFEKPGEQAPKCPATGEPGGVKFSSRDATHAMKSYGLCLDSIGETTALQGCEMGDLQHNGSHDAANLCKVVEGPVTPGIVCAIM